MTRKERQVMQVEKKKGGKGERFRTKVIPI